MFHRERRRSSWTVSLVSLCAALAAFSPCASGASLYQIPWHATDMSGAPIVPKTLIRANESLPFRIEAAVRYMACGDEIRFLRMLQAKKSDTDILGMVLGKMAYYSGLPDDQGAGRSATWTASRPIRLARRPPDPTSGGARSPTATGRSSTR